MPEKPTMLRWPVFDFDRGGCPSTEENKGAVPYFLANPDLQLILFGGKGGVGKTTCAAAAALRIAREFPAKSYLLVSTDPAHSLKDSLAGAPLPENLQLLELQPREALETFKNKHGAKLRQIASRGTFLDAEDISRLLDLSLPGLDELIAFMEISRWVEKKTYAGIIVDTAPAGHTLNLLRMPATMRQWLGALDALLAKERYMKARFQRVPREDEIDRFLRELTLGVRGMEELLGDPTRCRFVPVMLAEPLSILESSRLIADLEEMGVPVIDIVVNRLSPPAPCPACAVEHACQKAELSRMASHCNLSWYTLWGIPLHPGEVRGLVPLTTFWENVVELPEGKMEDLCPPAEDCPRVESAAPYPPAEINLLFFAGKGGVGKTTLACGTALRLAQDLPGKKILLFSIDPAHSLGDCLEAELHHLPRKIFPNLTAMEIDAKSEFARLKGEYEEDLRKFLGALSPHFDLPFDRKVMEKILDWSPPGLDEIMALTTIMKFLKQGAYDLFICDAAPTGHLLRLLELPELIDQWLKVFFGLFLKYKEVFRLPRVSQRLVQMSKDLKVLRGLLQDPTRSSVYAVSMLTEMCLQETRDLAEACARMKVDIGGLFLNLATPKNDCPLCDARFREEAEVRGRFQQTFPDYSPTVIYRQGNPRGRQALGKLGKALYLPLSPVAREENRRAKSRTDGKEDSWGMKLHV